MNLLEFIGFIAMMLFLLTSMRQKKRLPKQHEEEENEFDESEQAKRLKAFLQGIDQDMEKTKHAPRAQYPQPGAPIQKKQQLKKSVVQQPYIQSTVETTVRKEPSSSANPYKIQKTHEIGRAQALLRKLKSPQEMVILHEILAPPLALRENTFDHPR